MPVGRGIAVSERAAALTPEQRARCERLVSENAPLARWAAGRFASLVPHMELDDVESLMLEVLWISTMTWDPKRATLGTYAVNLMRWHALRRSNAPYRPCGIRHAPDGYQPLRLDWDGPDGGWADILADPTGGYEQVEGEREAERLLSLMTPRERDIAEKRIAGYTLEEISQRHGVTRERIRQILKGMERVMVAA